MGWLARLPPSLSVRIACCKFVPTLVVGALFLPPLPRYSVHSKALGTLVGEMEEEKWVAQIGLGMMPLMVVWAAGRGHTMHTRYLGVQQPWEAPSRGGPEVSYGHTRYPEAETKHPLPRWHLARACLTQTQRGTFSEHFLCALHCGSHPTAVLSQGGGCYAHCTDEKVETQRGNVTGLGHTHTQHTHIYSVRVSNFYFLFFHFYFLLRDIANRKDFQNKTGKLQGWGSDQVGVK